MSKRTDDYVHISKTRKNNPDVGLSVYDKEIPKKSRYDYDPHLDPQLVWTSKSEKSSFEVPIVSLLTQEKINSKKIINNFLKDTSYQATLDHFFKKMPLNKSIEFYRHDIDWTNRLILGDSLIIMNSLINKEGMAGKVQMIYIDPPYGIKFNSNFQVNISSREVKDGQDKSLTRELEQIKAFRDTWELGIHSYLSYMRDRLILSRALLSETGSIFVQINDENLPYIILLMQEIFGKENLISIIPFKKTGSASSKTLATICDYIIWFARNKQKVKYHQLYKKREIDANTLKTYTKIELKDGSRRALTSEEKTKGLIPKNAKLFTTISLTSQDYQENRSKPFTYNGKQFNPPRNRHWSVSIEEGLPNLAKRNRLYETENSIRFIYFLDDFPIIPLSNMWDDTMGETSPLYVVQTNTKIIQRCMLMTTDVGDIVFDPTCGSGTSAYVAEQWGRRWITCDTSRIAINIAKQRIITAFFDYYKISDLDQLNFIYKKFSHISASTIAYNKEVEFEILYDDPEIDHMKIRVSGPFTYETISSSQIMISIEEALMRNSEEAIDVRSFNEKVLFYLKHDGLSYPNHKKLQLKNILPFNKGFLNARGIVKNGENEETVGISIGPEFGDVSLIQVERSIYSALHEHFDWLIVVGFSFDEAAQIKLVHNKPDPDQLKCEMALINPDIEIEDLQKKPSGVQMFTIFGKPEVNLVKIDEKFQAELIAIDIYDPQTGLIDSVSPDKINVWFIDENFDGHTFFIHQIIFPNPNKITEKIKQKLKGLIEDSKLEFLTGTKSLPIEPKINKKIAIKIIDFRGNELLSVFDLKDKKME